MSRSYRIKVRDSLRRLLRAEDQVSAQLELLEILPCDQMAALLGRELERRGFQRIGDQLRREQNGVRVTIDPKDGTITVGAESAERVRLATSKEGRAWDDLGADAEKLREALKKEARQELEQQAEQRAAALRGQVADRLEGELRDLKQELDQAVNRVTAEALKLRAAQLGQIKQLTEDPQTGSLTIVLEV